MEVYMVEREDLKRVRESEFDKEVNLEKRLIRTDGATIGDTEILYIGRQGSPGEGGIFDILGVDKRGDSVIVELKRDRAPRDIVVQALEYASEIRNVEYNYLADQYHQFLREDQGYDELTELSQLDEAHAEYFDLDEPLSEREFNTEQRLVVVGTDFRDVSLNMADFLREHGIDTVCVEYAAYADEEDDVELLVTENLRRPLSEEPSTTTQSEDNVDYSPFIRRVQERVFPQINDLLNADAPEEMFGGSSDRTLSIHSNHPEHPDNLTYLFKPRFEEEAWDRQNVMLVGISVRGGDNDTKEFIQASLTELSGELEAEGFDVRPDKWLRIVQQFLQSDSTLDKIEQEDIELAGDELVTLIELVHPTLTEGEKAHE